MARCEFCGQDKPLSKEHVWSSAVLRLFDAVAPMTFDRERGRAYGADPVVKDLCRDCNSALSPTDTAMRAFAEQYLVSHLDQHLVVHFDHLDLLRWIMKTVANCERCINLETTWWREFVPFFRGEGGDIRRVDLFLAPWRDLSPLQVATETNMVLVIGAEQAHFARMQDNDPRLIHAMIETTWALKIGSGVFLLVVWKLGAPVELVGNVAAELRKNGWMRRGEDNLVNKLPFNAFTCVKYSILSDPSDMRFFEELAAKRPSLPPSTETVDPWDEPPSADGN